MPALADDVKPSSIPKDVTDFLDQRDKCAHFADEEPYDAARKKFLADQIKLYCTDIDRKQIRLEKKYQGDPKTLEMLQQSPDD